MENSTTTCSYEHEVIAGTLDSYPVITSSICITSSQFSTSTSGTSTPIITYYDWIFVNGFVIFLLALIAFRFLFNPLR